MLQHVPFRAESWVSLLPVWPWATHLNSLSFSSCVDKMKILITAAEDLLRGLNELLQRWAPDQQSHYNVIIISLPLRPEVPAPCGFSILVSCSLNTVFPLCSQQKWLKSTFSIFLYKEEKIYRMPHSPKVTWEALLTPVRWAWTLCKNIHIQP